MSHPADLKQLERMADPAKISIIMGLFKSGCTRGTPCGTGGVSSAFSDATSLKLAGTGAGGRALG